MGGPQTSMALLYGALRLGERAEPFPAVSWPRPRCRPAACRASLPHVSRLGHLSPSREAHGLRGKFWGVLVHRWALGRGFCGIARKHCSYVRTMCGSPLFSQTVCLQVFWPLSENSFLTGEMTSC